MYTTMNGVWFLNQFSKTSVNNMFLGQGYRQMNTEDSTRKNSYISTQENLI